MGILVCINHPGKPANKKCKKCNAGLCKYCKARETTNSSGDWDGFICDKCESEAKKGVMKFTP